MPSLASGTHEETMASGDMRGDNGVSGHARRYGVRGHTKRQWRQGTREETMASGDTRGDNDVRRHVRRQ
ncbi:hypothetical protein RRG08_005215 [Elysia crispata]|uniref:Uncharacterized protein n=1 Tax=Elysia crispata TaxID=231223 RepID=A0AAE0ZZ29_9GAST|nr:hypothetical protein RRG08_005215 [Elysia crispata]